MPASVPPTQALNRRLLRWRQSRCAANDALPAGVGCAVQRIITDDDDVQPGVLAVALLDVVAAGAQVVGDGLARFDRNFYTYGLTACDEVGVIDLGEPVEAGLPDRGEGSISLLRCSENGKGDVQSPGKRR